MKNNTAKAKQVLAAMDTKHLICATYVQLTLSEGHDIYLALSEVKLLIKEAQNG